LRVLGLRTVDLVGAGPDAMLREMGALGGPLLLMRAGAWRCRRRFELPRASDTGRPLVALGAARVESRETAATAEGDRVLASCGGDFEVRQAPPVVAAFVGAAVVAAAAANGTADLDTALREAAFKTRAR